MSDFEERLQKEIAQLPDSVTPERDLWKGVELAIDDEQPVIQKNRNELAANAPLYAMAASVMFLAFAVYALVLNTDATQQLQPALALAMQTQHQEQKRALLVSFSNKTPLSSDWQKQMQELDEAEKAILSALENDPDNHALLKMLQQVYQQQLSLIENVYNPKWQAI